MQCMSNAPSIVELSLDGNPFSSSVDSYRMLALSQMRQLHHLDMIPISVRTVCVCFMHSTSVHLCVNVHVKHHVHACVSE